ncbi:MAG: hypothetical protein JWR21_2397 [Herminiimonas sp.]|nr:hypothetical protein [Herminiimonas sp.]MDB5854239.1 hypothetical protein [Herminiimonas sp.]
MKTKKRIAALALMAASLFGICEQAAASLIYNLDIGDAGSGNLSSGQYGTVTLHDPISGSLTVDVQLGTGYTFVVSGGGGAKNTFAYSLTHSATQATGMVFSVAPSPSGVPGIFTAGLQTQTPFGAFTDSITLNDHGNTIYNHLVFTLASTAFQDFIVSVADAGHAGGYLFSADVALDGKTFTVVNSPGDTPSNGRVPEPATLALLGLGLLGFAVSRRKQQS